jgi:protein SCO1/2
MGIMTRALTAAACVSAPATSRFAGFPVVQVMPSLAPASRFFSADAASSSNVAAAAASAAAVASATPGAGAADGNSKGKGSDNTTMFNTKVHQPKMNPLPMLFALLMGIGGYIYLTQAERKQKTVSSTVTHQSGKIEIGGPFSGLVDQDGLPASSDQYAGQYTLIYFGFTHCPDICPTELQKMMRAINKVRLRSHASRYAYARIAPFRALMPSFSLPFLDLSL